MYVRYRVLCSSKIYKRCREKDVLGSKRVDIDVGGYRTEPVHKLRKDSVPSAELSAVPSRNALIRIHAWRTCNACRTKKTPACVRVIHTRWTESRSILSSQITVITKLVITAEPRARLPRPPSSCCRSSPLSPFVVSFELLRDCRIHEFTLQDECHFRDGPGQFFSPPSPSLFSFSYDQTSIMCRYLLKCLLKSVVFKCARRPHRSAVDVYIHNTYMSILHICVYL